MEEPLRKEAIILDTNIIGREQYTLDDMLISTNDFFTVQGVMQELAGWERKKTSETVSEGKRLASILKQLKKDQEDLTYRTMEGEVRHYESVLEIPPNYAAARIFTEATNNPLVFQIARGTSQRKKIKEFFEDMQAAYQDILTDWGLTMSIKESKITVALQADPHTKSKRGLLTTTRNITSLDEITDAFTDFSILIQARESEQDELEKPDPEYEEAQKIRGRFIRQPQHIINPYVPKIIRDYSKLSPKALAWEVYNFSWRKKPLTQKNHKFFLEKLNDRAMAEIMKHGGASFSSQYLSILKKSMAAVDKHILNAMHYNEGKLKRPKTYTDTSLVAAAAELAKSEKYRKITIATGDADIAIIAGLTNLFYDAKHQPIYTTVTI